MDIYYLVCGIILMATGHGFIFMIPHSMSGTWRPGTRWAPGVCLGVMGVMQVILACLVIIVATRPGG